MASKLSCFVCQKKEANQNSLKKLDQVKFEKCCEILAIKKAHKLVYSDVILPAVLTENEVYHPKCYKKFTALSKKYRSDADPAPSASAEANQNDDSDEM